MKMLALVLVVLMMVMTMEKKSSIKYALFIKRWESFKPLPKVSKAAETDPQMSKVGCPLLEIKVEVLNQMSRVWCLPFQIHLSEFNLAHALNQKHSYIQIH